MRCTCRMIRLYYQKNYPCVIDSFSKRKLSNLMWPRTYHVAFTKLNSHWNREFAVLAADNQHVADNETKNLLVDSQEKMRENDYARKLFLNSTHYKNTVMQQNTTYAHITNEEALEILEQKCNLITQDQILMIVKKLSYNILYSKESIDPAKYENIFNMLLSNYQKLSNDDLLTLIKHLVPLRELLQKFRFYQTLCDYLDKECIQRFSNLPINETLLLCDTMYLAMYTPWKNQYIWYSMKKIGAKPHRLSPHELVQVLFFLNICRKPPINMYEFEYCLEQYMDDLSINELGVASLGFFKTGTPFRSGEFLHRIIKKIIAEVDVVDSVSIGALLKQMRFSMQLTQIPTLQELLKVLAPHTSRFTLMSLIHIAHACAKVALYDKEIIDKIIERFNSELKTARLKDIERLIFVFSCLNIDPNNSIYKNVIEELRTTWDTSRASEISKFPYVASRLLGFLAVLGIYPTDLIKHVMSPEYIHASSKGNYHVLSREYCVLDYGLKVEVPEYDGPFLKPSLLTFLERKHFQYSSKSSTEKSRSNVLLTSVLETCKELFNTMSNISVIRPLPHYLLPDIVFCLDKQNQLVPTSEFLSQFAPSDIKRVDQEEWNDVRWIALVIGHPLLLLRQSNLPTGPLAAKIRQLSKIGYTPLLITHDNWVECRSIEEKCNYIKYFVFKNDVSEQSSR